MNLEPSLLNFKTEHDVNFAIANAFIFAFSIDRSKFLLDTLVWNAEKEINDDLFIQSAPWYKGYAETKSGGTPRIDERPSDKPTPEESAYFSRNQNLIEYVPKSSINPAEAITEMSYKLIDNRVAILALSWWTMFISTKDGKRIIYYPYSSQIKDSINLEEYPTRTAWFKDNQIAEYYRNIGIDTKNMPEILTTDDALDLMYSHMKALLQAEGLKFVLWLYNYIKLNNFLVPFDYQNEYVKSFDTPPVYRGGIKVDLKNPRDFGKTAPRSDITSQQPTTVKTIHGSTGISQTEFPRNYHSCGILLNTSENIDDLSFTNMNMKNRLNKLSIDPFMEFIDRESIKWSTDISIKSIDSNYVLDYINASNIPIKDFQYVTVTSSLTQEKRFFSVKKDISFLTGMACRLIGIGRLKTGDRIQDEAVPMFNMFLRIRLRPYIETYSRINLNSMKKYQIDMPLINRNLNIFEENHELWKTGKRSQIGVQIRRSR